MNPPHDHQHEPDPQDRGVTPLTRTAEDRTPYVRFPDVEAETLRALADGPSAWNVKKLKSETLVHLIRVYRWRTEMSDVHGRLFDEIGRRVAVIVRDNAKGFGLVVRDQIQSQIEHSVLALILILTPTRKSDFLEINFRRVVKGLTLNEVTKTNNLPMQQFALSGGNSGDGESGGGDLSSEIEDDGLSPEDLACIAENRERVRTALNGLTDKRHREAVILRLCEDWPIWRDDSSEATIYKYFGGSVTRRQIHNWIKGAMAKLRAAIGEKS
jgi:hypothetical protein